MKVNISEEVKKQVWELAEARRKLRLSGVTIVRRKLIFGVQGFYLRTNIALLCIANDLTFPQRMALKKGAMTVHLENKRFIRF